MNTKKLVFKSAVGAMFTAALLFSSCGKKAQIETAANNEEATAQNKEEGDAIGNETQNITDAAAKNGSSIVGRVGSSSFMEIAEASQCATITRDTTATIRTISIEFGLQSNGSYSNCLCNDGRYRRGKIIVTHTGNYFDDGSVKTITFLDFYRNDNRLQGTRVVTNKGLNSSGNRHWEVVETDMIITKADGKIHTWNSTRNREMLSGSATPYVWLDDEYQITGGASGVNQNGINYTSTITTPLHRNMNCKWIDKGIIEFENDKGAKRTIDYGNGLCDAIATVTVTSARGKTKTKEITLK